MDHSSSDVGRSLVSFLCREWWVVRCRLCYVINCFSLVGRVGWSNVVCQPSFVIRLFVVIGGCCFVFVGF